MSTIYGVVTAEVVSVEDPQGEGRVKVRYKWLPGNNEGYWAPVATAMAGPDRGMWYMPEVDDEVLVAFEQGDVNHPFIIGFLWHGQHSPPTTDPDLRMIRTVNGHEITIYDPDIVSGDTGYIRIEDAQGNRVQLSNAMVSIRSVGVVKIDAPTVMINGRLVAPAPKPI